MFFGGPRARLAPPPEPRRGRGLLGPRRPEAAELHRPEEQQVPLRARRHGEVLQHSESQKGAGYCTQWPPVTS